MPDTSSSDPSHVEATVNVRNSRLSVEMLAFLVALLAQTGGFVWWASGINNRVGHIEETIRPLSDGSMTATLARIDERTGSMKDRVNRMSDRLYQLTPPSQLVQLPPRIEDERR